MIPLNKNSGTMTTANFFFYNNSDMVDFVQVIALQTCVGSSLREVA